MQQSVAEFSALRTYLATVTFNENGEPNSLSSYTMKCFTETQGRLTHLLDEMKQDVQCMPVRFFARKAAWLKTSRAKHTG